MKKETFFLNSSDGKNRLHGFFWLPEGDPRALVQITHGMAEYIDRYDPFASFLANQGYAVIGHDHLGHGQTAKSDADLGFFAEKDGDRIVIDDIHLVTLEAKKRFPGKKILLLGHSMGSFMTRRYLAVYSKDLDGAIIMGTGNIPAPVAGLGVFCSKVSVLFHKDHYRSKFLTGLALGSNNKPFAPNRTEVDWLSRNNENVDRYVADPLCGFLFTNAAFRDFFTVMKKIAKQEGFDTIRRDLPLLIISGELDPVGGKKACTAVKAQYDQLGFTDVTLKLYPEDRHEILNELDREQVFSDLLLWIAKKTA